MKQSSLCLTKTDPLTKTPITWARKACASTAEHVVPLAQLQEDHQLENWDAEG